MVINLSTASEVVILEDKAVHPKLVFRPNEAGDCSDEEGNGQFRCEENNGSDCENSDS